MNFLELATTRWKMFIFDEAHFLKEEGSQRTKVAKQITKISSGIIQLLTGTEYKLTVKDEDSIEIMKQKIEEVSGVPAPQQRLICRGKNMADGKIVKDYELKHGDKLHMVLQLRGG